MKTIRFTDNEWGYVADVLEGCIEESLNEDEGIPSISHEELIKLLEKIR